MSRGSQAASKSTVAHFCRAMESIAPTGLAQSWDNVGLIAGDVEAPVRRVLLCIDLTPAVVDEAVRDGVDIILTYHPPILRPIAHLHTPSGDTDAVVFRCIRQGIAIYAAHTALDAAEGGTNDVIASLCGIKHTEPIEYVDEPSANKCKMVIFVPAGDLDKVSDAVFAAGAGHIGDYSHCSYRTTGRGTFLGGETTHPTIGERGRLEYADEIRLEVIVPDRDLPTVVNAMREAHSYEEPAFDIYPLKPQPVRGIGRVGKLPRPVALMSLARRLKRAIEAACVQIIGPPDRVVERAVIVVGAAGSLPFRLPLSDRDAVVTGEIRHHDALTMLRHSSTAIALGHWASERPVLPHLADRLQPALTGVTFHVSQADQDPFRPV